MLPCWTSPWAASLVPVWPWMSGQCFPPRGAAGCQCEPGWEIVPAATPALGGLSPLRADPLGMPVPPCQPTFPPAGWHSSAADGDGERVSFSPAGGGAARTSPDFWLHTSGRGFALPGPLPPAARGAGAAPKPFISRRHVQPMHYLPRAFPAQRGTPNYSFPSWAFSVAL